MMKNTILSSLVSVIFVISIFGCSSSNKSPANNAATLNSQPTTPVTTNVAASANKIKFKTAGGSDLFSLKQQADGAKLIDGNNQELARIKVDKPGRIKFKNAADQVLGYVVTAKGNWTLKNQEGNQDLYIFKRLAKGDYQLEDAAKKEIYQVKPGKNGLEIGTPTKQLVYQVKVKEGKISLINPSQTIVFYTKSGISPIAFACLAFDTLTREQQMALAYAVNLTGGQ